MAGLLYFILLFYYLADPASIIHIDDIEEFLPLLVEVVIVGEALLHMYDSLFLCGFSERVGADFHWCGAVAVDVHQTIAVFESVATDFLPREGQGKCSQAGATLESIATDFEQRVGQ